MQPTDKIALARNYMAVWNAGQDNRLDTYAHPNISIYYSHYPQAYEGLESCRQMLLATYSFFPDLKIELLNIIPADSAVTVYWEYTGTHKAGNLFGKTATGKTVQVKGMTVLEIDGERVIKEYGVVDNLAVLTGIGALQV
ncbi:ester cyclase [Chitinophaga agrisoli]|uniref:Ester cyclase n=1 Tax=Chitinophaga agrisoli TaxID=2607653 RepID=A0A5B2VMG3_9BACT|nr:ester cyclase [Chitinophaga agrisoli]KAA2239457.1 ester cyclase [Chitinophaga agrisoli]